MLLQSPDVAKAKDFLQEVQDKLRQNTSSTLEESTEKDAEVYYLSTQFFMSFYSFLCYLVFVFIHIFFWDLNVFVVGPRFTRHCETEGRTGYCE